MIPGICCKYIVAELKRPMALRLTLNDPDRRNLSEEMLAALSEAFDIQATIRIYGWLFWLRLGRYFVLVTI